MSHLPKQSQSHNQNPLYHKTEDAAVPLFSPAAPIEEGSATLSNSPTTPSRTSKPAQDHTSTRLAEADLALFFGPTGPLAAALDGYELRPSQLEMAQAAKEAILNAQHALIEAPTGTGKSIAYLIPAILSGKTVIVATANKSLQSQLFFKDIPFLRQVLKPLLDHEISAVIVKGRSNFVCNYKWEKEATTQKQIALYDREHEQVKFMHQWLEETETGDVDDLPFLLDSDLRPRIVSYPDDCLHQDCRFYYDGCWVNNMRDKAAEAQILITNHHLLLNALELGWAGERLLPSAQIYIVDEAHGLEGTATAVFETSITDYTVEQLLSRTLFTEYFDSDELDERRFQNTLAFQEVAMLSRDNAYRIESDLEELKKLSRNLSAMAQKLRLTNPFAVPDPEATDDDFPPKASAKKKKATSKGKGPGQDQGKGATEEEQAEARRAYELAMEALNSTATKLLNVATSNRDSDIVRYAVRVFDRRHTTIEVHAAPINPATYLRDYLFHPETTEPEAPPPDSDDETEGEATPVRTVICTSATLATGGNFTHFKQRCGLDEVGVEKILPPVFDYDRQALLYQPPLPAYDYRNADGYYSAVAAEIDRLLQVSRGRALCLFTSWSGLQQVNDRLRNLDHPTIWPLRAQGDAPRDALISWFKETDHSVLLATRSFWEGVDIPGDDLTLVVLDKMPFPTPNDPLHSARMRLLDGSGGNSFGDYMMPLMNLALKQGFGRLIRRGSDSGVVAILDERLSSKPYGRQTRQDLPPARFSRQFKDVHKFYQTSLASTAEFALNLWAWPAKGDPLDDDEAERTMQWRWQLLRLQDGKADEAQGRSPFTDVADAECFAALQALADLRNRIERAGRKASDFSVELRCAAFKPTGQSPDSEVAQTWQHEAARWQAITRLPIAATAPLITK